MEMTVYRWIKIVGSSIERPDKIADTVSPTGCAELYSSILTKELCLIYEKEIRYLNNNLSFETKHHLTWENDRSKVSSTRDKSVL